MHPGAEGMRRRMTTRRELEQRPESQLAYPNSVLLDAQGVDEGEGTGFDNLDRSAAVDRWSRAPAGEDEILAWYTTQLQALNWIKSGSSEDGEMLCFIKGAEKLDIVIWQPNQWSWPPPGDDGQPGTIYRMYYRVPPRPGIK